MSERENNVYKAKLAEQAERYDGELNGLNCYKARKKDLQSFRHRRPDPVSRRSPNGFLQTILGDGYAPQ